MPPKIIKLSKKDDIASVVKQIRNLRDKEIMFELEKGSTLLRSSDNLKLMKRTGEAMGKKILVTTDDEIGRVLAKKAGVLKDASEVKMPKVQQRVARSDIKPRFSDIMDPHKAAVKKVVASAAKVMENVSLPKLSFAGAAPSSLKIIRNSPSTKYFVIGILILVIGFLALAVVLPKASITIFARSEPVYRDLEVNLDVAAKSMDTSKLVVPAQSVTKEVSQTKTFPATGTSAGGQKASGSVTIYNQTPYTLTLKAATTTLVSGTHKYVFTKDVAGIKPNGQTGPVGIVATAGGDGYNLAAGTKLEIVNQALGNLNVYAQTVGALSGGLAGSGKSVSQEDLDRARLSLINDIITQAETDLTADQGQTVKLLTSTNNQEVLASTANKNVGDTAESFDMTVIAKVGGLAYHPDDVLNLVKAKINEVMSSDKYLVDGPNNSIQTAFKAIDLVNGRGLMTVHYETVAAYKVNASNLAPVLSGKNESEIKEILLSKPEVDSVNVIFWPAWLVHKAPWLNGKITITTELSH